MLVSICKRLAADRRGATATIFGLTAVVLLITIGVAFDSARLYSISDKVRNALDASALAGAKLLDVDDATDHDVKARAAAYFETYRQQIIGNSVSLTNLVVTTNRTENTVTATVDIDYETAFGKLISVPYVKFAPSATVLYKSKKIELAMVLDITGSMCEPGPQPCTSGPKINGLKAAAKDLIDVMAANGPDAGAVRIGIVPYSASVNIDSFYNLATNGAASPETCVVERNGVSGRNDDPPAIGRWFDPAPVGQCPSSGPIIALEDVSVPAKRTSMKQKIDDLWAELGTAGHIGTAWGWYMLSPNWSAFWPSANAPKPFGPNVLKAVLIMTDGIFNLSYAGGYLFTEDCSTNNSSCEQAMTLCDNMKAQGITVYTVGFQAPPSAEVLLTYCASSAANYFPAANAADLSNAFRTVADRLSMLRIAQ